MIYRIITILAFGLTGFAYIFPIRYMSELFFSFLPYVCFFFFFVSLFWLFRFIFFCLKKNNFYFKLESIFFVVVSLFLFFVSGLPLFNFYGNQQRNAKCEGGSTVLFVNLYWDNRDYEAIEDFIEEEDPDVLLLVEFSEHHYEHLYGFLKERYPYVNRAVWSKNLMVGSMVFSKSRVYDLSLVFPQGAWRYGYFAIDFDDVFYYFYLVHTSSPVSKDYRLMRQKQLEAFVQDYNEHALSRQDGVVVVVGDFNISPWSPTFVEFVEGLGSGVVDLSADKGLVFTWFLEFSDIELRFLRSHIDHLFVSVEEDSVIFDNSISFPGSDHKALLFDVGCNYGHP